MPRFVVNNNPQDTGEHEVHEEGCSWFPQDYVDLGIHVDCKGAVIHAKEHHSNVDGCKHCCPACHTR